VSAEDRIEELFSLSPEEFVAARDELAKQLRGEGDADGSRKVKALRRPTVAAWAVNQVARRHPEHVEDLLAAGRDLREGQRRMMSGRGRADLAALGARRRTVVDRLTRLATEVLEEAGRGVESHRDEIADTFTAAAVDESVAELVRAGRLDRERTPPSDLADAFGLSDEADGDDDETAADESERDGEAEAAAAAAAAERTAERARRDADRAEDRAERARAELRAAREAADRKAEAVRDAEERAAAARDAANEAQRDLDRLRRRS
jgi:hypothetical protein